MQSVPRPPIVVVMGHVDHGKTTLLDFIRKTTVASREAGGITQSVGAYEIVHAGKTVTFIDTPGHEAFACMRIQGAKSADLAILVVAADDSVKPQTKDALACIVAEKIPFVVAVNKIDKPGANIEKVKSDLAQANVFLEGYGGNVSWQAISAKNGEGVPELLDLILLAADVENLTFDPTAPASGMIVTARLDKRRGIVASAIVENGTLKRGNYIATESASGKIKILENFLGKTVQSLAPSSPALILGFETLPRIGEVFTAGPIQVVIKKRVVEPKPATVAAPENEQSIPLLLKADESGSLEALEGVIAKNTKTLPFIVAARSIGDIYETDVKTAESAGAIIVGFRTGIDRAAQNLARARKVNILTSQIIYELEKELKLYADKMIVKEVRAIEIRGVFGKAKNKEHIIGGAVLLGPIKNQEAFEIWQDKRMVGSGKILNLQALRKDIQQAETGTEVGLLVETDEPVKLGNKLIFPNV